MAFYDAALGALGLVCVWATPTGAGYGQPDGEDKLAIKQVELAFVPLRTGFHVAFTARSPLDVAAFHAAALANGGTDNGPPGLRPQYGWGYHAAFVLDPDGHALEAVFHAPQAAPQP